jgi:hypothetical protein
MLADPLVIDASFITAADLPAISREPNKSVYQLVVGAVTYKVTISHVTAKGRRRSVVRIDANTIASNPYDSTTSVDDTTSVYLVIDRSERLVSNAAVVTYVVELLGVLGACTFANAVTTRITQIVGGES